MQRRNAVIALAGLAALPRVLGAQPQRAARIGILATLPPSNSFVATWYAAFYGELKARGWEEGRNLVVEARYTEGHPEKYSTFAGELVSAGVELIVATDSQAVDTARKATRTIPIVMTNVSHTVEAGYVASLAHPGGNITGVTSESGDLTDKSFELFRSIRPDVKKFGILWSPHNRGSALGFKTNQDYAHDRGLAVVSLPVDASVELDPALAKAQRDGVQALFVHPTPAIAPGFQRILSWATQNRVMTESVSSFLTRRGFLLSYGADVEDLYRLTATFVDRILRGAKPMDLPVEQPTKFDLVVNLKTAKSLGLTIPRWVLARADEVIQ